MKRFLSSRSEAKYLSSRSGAKGCHRSGAKGCHRSGAKGCHRSEAKGCHRSEAKGIIVAKRRDHEGLSFVFFTRVTPAKKKIAPSILNINTSFIVRLVPLPFMNFIPATINPATPSSERIMPNTRFSIL